MDPSSPTENIANKLYLFSHLSDYDENIVSQKSIPDLRVVDAETSNDLTAAD